MTEEGVNCKTTSFTVLHYLPTLTIACAHEEAMSLSLTLVA